VEDETSVRAEATGPAVRRQLHRPVHLASGARDRLDVRVTVGAGENLNVCVERRDVIAAVPRVVCRVDSTRRGAQRCTSEAEGPDERQTPFHLQTKFASSSVLPVPLYSAF